MSQEHKFERLEVPLMGVNAKETPQGYRVYSTPKEFTLIQANSAWEAIEKSQIKHPYKVLHTQHYECLCGEATLENKGFEAFGTELKEEPVIAPSSAPAAEPTEPPIPEESPKEASEEKI